MNRPEDDAGEALARALGEEHRASASPPDFEPLNTAETDAVADAVLARLGIAPAPGEAAPPAPPSATVVALTPRPRPTRRVAVIWAGAGLALAAGLAVTVFRPSETTLPAYALSAVGDGARELRGDGPATSAVPRYRAGNTVTLVARPERRSVDETVKVVAYVSGPTPDAPLAPWQPRVDVDPGGAVRLVDTVGRPPLTGPGPRTLVVAVTRTPLPAAVAPPSLKTLTAAVDEAGGQVLTLSIQLVEGNPP
jgi:hypothetical protein